ncbi:hypothetical protein ACFO1B_43950 [Dactylosporangium siamense]|uniref:Uncharacterized protein n=1 Tax=Dactylosporangium siamense TaxID=685454 RepID=A0A919PZH3_9ACTN|nr:hypothetical protein [Dactylosporangium siamense]GIG53206.1 hypothetical protein Dsi01nite_112470 [Dactylosporangium siamense]
MTSTMEPTGTEPAAIDPVFRRLETASVPITPTGSAEYGFTIYARELAQQLCHTLHGSSWLAATRSPFMPHPRVDRIADVTVVIDRRHLVTVRHLSPAGHDMRDTWTVFLNCRPIPHRTFRGEVPHQVDPIVRSVWRHQVSVRIDPCDTLGCTAPATVASYRHVSLCPACANRFRETGR